MRKILLKRHSFCSHWIFAFMVLSIPTLSLTFAVGTRDALQGIQILSEHKESGASQALLLSEMFQENDLSHQEFLKGKLLYGEAKAAFNAWINQLQSNLAIGLDLALSEKYQGTLRKAATKSDLFTTYVREKIEGSSKGELADKIRGVFDAFRDSGRYFWNKVSGQKDQKKRKQFIQELEEYKWESFNRIHDKE